MAQRDKDSQGQEQRFPVRARRMERPVQDQGTQRGEPGRPGYGSFGAERGHRPVRPPRGYQRADDRIREDVCERLMEGPVDVGDVEVTVSHGEVTLSGTVEERWQKRAIEDMASNVRGVYDVHNRVRVRPMEGRPMARGELEPMRARDEQPQEARDDQPHMGG